MTAFDATVGKKTLIRDFLEDTDPKTRDNDGRGSPNRSNINLKKSIDAKNRTLAV